MKTKYFLSTAIISLMILWGCSDLQKELPQPTSPSVVHTQGWVEKTSQNYHGRFLKNQEWNLVDCIQCHGTNFKGGLSKVSCFNCHNSYPHSMNWNNTSNIEFHGEYLQSRNWNLIECLGCHGSDYDGGEITNISCMTSNCHIDANSNKKSPEACNTCHGNFSATSTDVNSWAPPKSVDGDSVSTFPGVGAHQSHLIAGNLGKAVKCEECHSVPTLINATGHMDSNLPAEVAMKDTLATGGGTIIPNPVYNYNENTCSNTYCHGNFKNGNKNFKPLWTDVSGNQVKCGTCHGDVSKPTLEERARPGGTHIKILPCYYCHYEVVDANMNIISKDKHINGKVDLNTPPKR